MEYDNLYRLVRIALTTSRLKCIAHGIGNRVLMVYDLQDNAIGCYYTIGECARDLNMTEDGIYRIIRKKNPDNISIKWISCD